MKRRARDAVRAAAAAAILLVAAEPAAAQTIDLQNLLGSVDGGTSGRIVQLVAALTVLSVAPGLLMMMTSFTRLVIAFSFLRSALGLQTTPSNMVVINLALFMTMFIMAPTFDRAWRNGLEPLLADKISTTEAYARISEPFREFMIANVREKDMQLMGGLAKTKLGLEAEVAKNDFRVLIPAFMLSELRRGFEIGFLIALPFLVIDMVVATVVMSMGMMMLPPTVFALPLKVLFFVLIDGWALLVGNLVRSYG